ncbi:hypothetical protein [Wenzhouxiangella sp. XN24]|uniref:hypothetical protein n=1 Tax=Wenzhouxiangella sp. XN24 TaxID=2713569 RepID=UPI0013EA88FC|nr:hypothetical protein [Wenzhouxiangella sp. XN24]NGX16302.1 hypothetical protein [Wenzhouxiangella sp. XN24]
MRGFLLLIFAAMAPAVHAQSDIPIQALDQRNFSLALPEAAFGQEGSSLAVDISGYDVTGFSRIDGVSLVVEMDSPLPPGEYLVTVLQVFADGNAAVLLDALLGVAEPDGGQYSLNGMLQSSYRVADGSGQAFDGTDESVTKGSLSFEGVRTSGALRLGSAVDVIYDRYNAATPPEERWLLPDYLVSATRDGAALTSSLKIGGVGVGQNDFVFSSFRRRGVSLETVDVSERFAIQAFSVVSTPRNLLRGEELLPRESDDRASGVTASISLLDDRLRFKGGLVDGRTSLSGAGFNNFGDPAVYGGETWNAGLQSTLVDGGIEISLERAGSRFDADGIGLGESARGGDAERATVVFSSAGGFGNGPFAYWSMQLEHREVGIDFYSLGNMSLPGNLRVQSAYLQAGFRDFAVDLDFARERSNPDDAPSLASQTLDRAGINFVYTPGMLELSRAPWRWLGAPSLNTWFYRMDSSQPDTDAVLVGFDVDNTTEEAGIGLSFAKDRLTWALQVGLIDYTDRSVAVFDGPFLLYEPPSDSRNVQVSLQMSWVPTERTTLDAFVQNNQLDESESNNAYRNRVYGVGGSFVLLPDKLSARASVSIGRDQNSFGNPLFLDERLRSRVADLQLIWHAVAARDSRPGLRLTLSGNYARNEDLAWLVDDELWSVIIGAQLDWRRDRP